MDEIYLTQEGYEKLIHELEYLKRVKRKEISKRVAEARLMGDLSENAEYDAAKDAQALLEKKIMDLEGKLSKARIISESEVTTDAVRIGVKVFLEDLDSGEKLSYTVLSDEEADFEKEQIGINSPVAQALLGKKKKDVVEVKVPRGTLRYRVIDISLP